MKKNERGSIDFMQLIAGLIIIVVVIIAFSKILVYGYVNLEGEMRYKKGLSIARSHVEYIQARIDSDFDLGDRKLIFGSTKTILLDARKPDTPLDNIYCEVSHEALIPVDFVETGPGVDFYKFWVSVKWTEPDGQEKEIEKLGTMIKL